MTLGNEHMYPEFAVGEEGSPDFLDARGYATAKSGAILVALTFATGVLYVLLQWIRHRQIEDALFASMLIGATCILVYGIAYLGRYLRTKGLGFCLFALEKEESTKSYQAYENLCHSVFHFKRMTMAGAIYGLVVGSVPFVLGVWDQDVVLKAMLAIFLYVANFVTGVAFYGLVVFFISSLRMGGLVYIDLWQIHNPATDFFMGATRRIAILASVYVSLCMSSILFSLLPITGLVIAYCCFAGAILIATIVIPPLPVVRNLREARANALFAIDKQIHLSFYSSLGADRSRKEEIDYESVKTLLELREKIEAINIWPFQVKSIPAALSVVILSAVPVAIELFLSTLVSGHG